MLKSFLLAPKCSTFSRALSTNAPKIYNFEDIKSLVQKPNPKKLLVDVRERAEVSQYAIPTAVNLPLKSAPGALGLSADEFRDVFNFEKPKTEEELIFFCAAGIRARAAEEIAKSYGYENTGVYPGSVHEWLEKGGDKLK